ncbi:MAG: hypothetical protein ACJASR_000148 [Psychroserpens sp.]|jgi:hypothetical protein
MKNYIIKLLEGDKGEKSTRRLMGIILTLTGISSSICLMFCGALVRSIESFTMYDKIENTSIWLIALGASLLGSTLIDKFSKK